MEPLVRTKFSYDIAVFNLYVGLFIMNQIVQIVIEHYGNKCRKPGTVTSLIQVDWRLAAT